VIPGVGVDVERFTPGDRAAEGPIDVAYLGRAVASKGLLDLKAASEPEAVPGVRLHLYLSRDPSSPGALAEDELEQLRQTDGIEVHDATRHPERVLGRVHASILASHAGEGVSKFVLESLACGTPVLLSAESGSGEVIEPGVTGLLFEARNPASIRRVLTEIASWSPTRWESARRACRSSAVNEYSLDAIAPRIVALHRAASEMSS
jgi:galacturonosyltransferase